MYPLAINLALYLYMFLSNLIFDSVSLLNLIDFFPSGNLTYVLFIAFFHSSWDNALIAFDGIVTKLRDVWNALWGR